MGYTGLLSVAHAAFYGIGAYASAILMRSQGMNFFVAMGLGVLLSMGVALLIGLVLSRFDGDYYALASLGFNVIVFGIMLNWEELTRGPLGIPGIGKPKLGDHTIFSNMEYFFFTLFFLIIIYLLARLITRSSFGRTLKGIREDETALQVFGYKTVYFKLAVFVIAAGMAAVAGSLYGSYITYIDPKTFIVMESIMIISMIILGGLANNRGAVIGATFFVLLPELLRFAGFPPDIAAHMRQIVYGVLLILLMMYRPQGLFGEYKL
tara:strand:- start:988 stop:1782 length:795 start_codon:yes stop_codon:yes gene_type:complete